MSARDDFLASHPGDDQNEIGEYHAWADAYGYPQEFDPREYVEDRFTYFPDAAWKHGIGD